MAETCKERRGEELRVGRGGVCIQGEGWTVVRQQEQTLPLGQWMSEQRQAASSLHNPRPLVQIN